MQGARQPLADDWTRLLAVVAHPDDLEHGVASAIARWTRAGKAVDGLGRGFDPDAFLRGVAAGVGQALGVGHAMAFGRAREAGV